MICSFMCQETLWYHHRFLLPHGIYSGDQHIPSLHTNCKWEKAGDRSHVEVTGHANVTLLPLSLYPCELGYTKAKEPLTAGSGWLET